VKIIKINIYLIAIGGLHPVLAEIVTDDGVTGIGEAAIAYGHGGTAAAR
jgi:galactonate dehydratase